MHRAYGDRFRGKPLGVRQRQPPRPAVSQRRGSRQDRIWIFGTVLWLAASITAAYDAGHSIFLVYIAWCCGVFRELRAPTGLESPQASEIHPGVEPMRLNRLRADTSSFFSSTSRNWRVGLGVLLICCCAGLPTYSAAQQRASLQQTPRAVREGNAQLIGQYDPDRMLRLVFALKPPHLEEEEQFLNQLQDRDSPLFHKYLSDKEWNERFAPSAQDEQAVVAWAQSQGLTITQRFPNRLLVDVEAPVAIIEKALDVAINRYQVGSALYYSNDRDPSIPAALASVVHAVLGLNNIEVAHSFSKGSQNFTGPDYSPGSSYTVGSHLARDAGKKPKNMEINQGMDTFRTEWLVPVIIRTSIPGTPTPNQPRQLNHPGSGQIPST